MAFRRGFEEDAFLRNINVEPKDFQFPCENCTKIYVWHTKTQKPNIKQGYVVNIHLSIQILAYFSNHQLCLDGERNGKNQFRKT